MKMWPRRMMLFMAMVEPKLVPRENAGSEILRLVP